MSMPVFKRVLATATAMAAAAVVFATPSASAAPSTPSGFTLVTHGDVSADVVDGLYYWQNAASSQCLNQDCSGGPRTTTSSPGPGPVAPPTSGGTGSRRPPSGRCLFRVGAPSFPVDVLSSRDGGAVPPRHLIYRWYAH